VAETTARKYTPRPRKAAAKPEQIPMVLEVNDQAKAAAVVPEGAPLAPVVLSDAIAEFASAIGMVEALAERGKHELIMQLARIAYTRGRQVARQAGVDVDNGQG
jgi:hypothetical protein